MLSSFTESLALEFRFTGESGSPAELNKKERDAEAYLAVQEITMEERDYLLSLLHEVPASPSHG